MLAQKIKTFLWFDAAAKDAAEFYCSLFPDSRITRFVYHPEGGPAPGGTIMTVEFSLSGVAFIALNGGPMFKFSEAVSLSVDCEDQAEVDFLWERLTGNGGTPQPCGWLKDRWGLSWQIIPKALPALLSIQKPGVAQRVLSAMMQMTKIDVAALQRAAESV